MTTHKEALTLARSVISKDVRFFKSEKLAAITVIDAALAQPEQERVAWRAWFDADNSAKWLFTLWPEEEHPSFDWQPLYTIPPQRKPLTDEHPLMMFAKECALGAYQEYELADAANKAIEAADKILKE